jgi:hypothetical protein
MSATEKPQRAAFSRSIDDQIGLTEQVEAARVGHARHGRDLALEDFRQAFQLAEIAAEDLDRILALHARDRLLDIVLDVLGEIEVHPDEFAPQVLAHLLDQVRLGHAPRPFLARFQRYEEFRHERAVGIGAVVAAPARTPRCAPGIALITLRMRATASIPAGSVMGGGSARIQRLPPPAWQELGAEAQPSTPHTHQECSSDGRRNPVAADRKRERSRELCGSAARGPSRPPAPAPAAGSRLTGVTVKVAMTAR